MPADCHYDQPDTTAVMTTHDGTRTTAEGATVHCPCGLDDCVPGTWWSRCHCGVMPCESGTYEEALAGLEAHRAETPRPAVEQPAVPVEHEHDDDRTCDYCR